MDDRSLYLEWCLDQEHRKIRAEEDEEDSQEAEGSYVEETQHGDGGSSTTVQAATDYTPEELEEIFIQMDKTGKSFDELLRERG